MQLSNAQHNQVMRVFQERRLDAKNTQKERKKLLYEAIPEMRELDLKLFETGLQLVDSGYNPDSNIDDISSKIHAQKLDLMEKHGFSRDYLDMPYRCKICEDTGYVDGEHCRCFYQVALEFLYSQSSIQDLLKNERLSMFDLEYYSDIAEKGENCSPRKQAQKSLEVAKDFVDNFKSNSDNIIITGGTGTGKTFLSRCIAGELLSKGYFVVFLSAFSLMSIIEQNTFDKPGDFSRADYESIFKADLLIIDDLGAENTNGFRNSKMFQCIDERILHNRSTIITTNLNLDQLSRHYSERTVSRLIYSYNFLELKGQDIRIQKKFA